MLFARRQALLQKRLLSVSTGLCLPQPLLSIRFSPPFFPPYFCCFTPLSAGPTRAFSLPVTREHLKSRLFLSLISGWRGSGPGPLMSPLSASPGRARVARSSLQIIQRRGGEGRGSTGTVPGPVQRSGADPAGAPRGRERGAARPGARRCSRCRPAGKARCGPSASRPPEPDRPEGSDPPPVRGWRDGRMDGEGGGDRRSLAAALPAHPGPLRRRHQSRARSGRRCRCPAGSRRHTPAIRARDRLGTGVAAELPQHTGTTPGPARRSAAPSPAAASPWARSPALLRAPPLLPGMGPALLRSRFPESRRAERGTGGLRPRCGSGPAVPRLPAPALPAPAAPPAGARPRPVPTSRTCRICASCLSESP